MRNQHTSHPDEDWTFVLVFLKWHGMVSSLPSRLLVESQTIMKIFVPLSLFVSAASAFVAASPFTTKERAAKKNADLNLYRSVEAAIAEAQRICSENPSSDECRVAWDIVEELEAADSHQGQSMDADGDYDTTALVGSFDILTQKIAGKMDR